ncbi:MAG: hypothetical protein JJU29_00470 [Verrucomicrobia bacterium]|nr:hypothetical protein [Verrucomicrobiota bacterium]MCH8510388.1 AsmA-like C-terminal region-containing protein [Kiritimatiellia bacterium]
MKRRTRKISNPAKRRLRRLKFSLGFLTLVILGFLALGLLGPPGFLVRAVLSDLEGRGIHLEIDEIYYRPVRGIVMKGVDWYSPKDLVTPFFSADIIHLRPGWRRKMRRGIWSAKIRVIRGTVEAETGLWADDFQTRQIFKVKALNANLYVQEDLFRLHNFTGRIGDVVLNMAGEFPLGPLDPDADDPAEEMDMDWVPGFARNLAQITHKLEAFSFSPLAEAQVRFQPSETPGHRVNANLEMDFSGVGIHRGLSFSRLRVKSNYDRDVLRVTGFELIDPEGLGLRVDARIDFEMKTARMRLRNNLSRNAIEHLSPVPLSRMLENLSVRVEGRCHVDLTFGPSSFERFGQELHGTLDVSEAYYRDAYFPELTLHLSYRNEILALKDIQAEVGHHRFRGPLSGFVTYDMNNGAMEMEYQSAFNPIAVISLIEDETAEQMVREWEFSGPPPQLTFTLARENRQRPLQLNMELMAEEVVSRGTYFESVRAKLEMENKQLRLTEFHASRGEEVLEGWLNVDLNEDLYEMDVTSTIRIHDLAPLVGPEAMELVRPYRIRGETWIKIAGVFDGKDGLRHDLQGKTTLRGASRAWLGFEEVSLSFHLEGTTLKIPDIHGTLREGQATGSLVVNDTHKPESANFKLNLSGEKIDLFEMVTAATDTTETPYSGTLSFDLLLEGLMQDPPGKSRFDAYKGTGNLKIEEGELFRIPLLLGLSRILSKVVRGFGYASQTDFSADVKIADGQIKSDNLFLRGNLMSIEGDGHIAFDRIIRANMRVQLLNEGILSDALKVVLWPLRKLIEIRLTGTLDEPDWEPRNLPKEIFGR